MAKSMPPGPDNFEFALVGDTDSKLPFRGYESTLDPTEKPVNFLDRGTQNVYLHISGRLVNREGRKLYDASVDATIAGCDAGHIWDTSLGQTYALRVANGKLQVESNVSGTRVWYDLLTSLTKTRFVFDSWWDNSDKKSKLLMANGTGGTIYDWSGGFGLFVSAIANTSITLSADPATLGFASAGTVTINGNNYTYTGINSGANKLTGVTGDASAEAVDSVVMQKIVTANSLSSGPSSTYLVDFIKVVNNQVYVGSYTSQVLYISKNTSYTDYGQSTPRLTGEGDFVLLDAPLTGIGARSTGAHVFAGTSLVYVITFGQITVGSVLSEQTNAQAINLGGNVAAQAHEFIDQLDDNVIYLDQNNQLRSFGAFRNLFTAKPVLLSQHVQTELAGVDFTNGQLKVITDQRGDIVYILAPNSGTVYLFQSRNSLDSVGNIIAERLWQPPQLWGIKRIGSLGGRPVGFSNANPQMYYLWNTNQWHDDSPNGSTAYTSVLVMPYRSFGRRQGKFRFDKAYWEGYITNGTSLYGAIYLDYQGATGVLTPIIHSIVDNSAANNQSFASGIVPPSLGDASLGNNPLGDMTQIVGLGNTALTDHDLLSKFRIITGVTPTDCFEYSLTCYTSKQDDRWELICLGTNPYEAPTSAVEIVKTII